MGKGKYYQYFVEGEDEQKLINTLKSEMNLILPGKVQVFNVTQEKLTKLRLMNLKIGTSIVLVFDADAGNLKILKDNIQFLEKQKVVAEIICIVQVKNLEDELLRSCDIRQIKDLLGSKSNKDYKADLLKEKNLKKRLEQREFDFTKFWSMSDTEKYAEIKNEADKIKIKNKK